MSDTPDPIDPTYARALEIHQEALNLDMVTRICRDGTGWYCEVADPEKGWVRCE